MRRQTLLPLQEAQVFGEGIPDEPAEADPELAEAQSRSDWIYEPEPEEALTLLFAEYVEPLGLPRRCSSRPPPSTGRG